MRMVMERGCPDEHRTRVLQDRVQALEERIKHLEGQLELLQIVTDLPPAPAVRGDGAARR